MVLKAGAYIFDVLFIDLPAPEILFLTKPSFKVQNIWQFLFGIWFDRDPAPSDLCMQDIAPMIPFFLIFLLRNDPWQQIFRREYVPLSACINAGTVHLPVQIIFICNKGY